MRKLVSLPASVLLGLLAGIASAGAEPSAVAETKAAKEAAAPAFAERWAPVAARCIVIAGHGSWCAGDPASASARIASIRMADALQRIAYARSRSEPVTEGRADASH